MSNRFEKNYKVNVYDVDSTMKCKFSSLLNYLWDVVIAQSESLGETKEGIIHNSCIWVLLKYDINIYEYPKFKDVITVDTEAIGIKKFYGYRNYTIKNSDGKIIGDAFSTAIVIDAEKRRPLRITPDQYDIYGITGEFDKTVVLDDLISLENAQYSKEYSIRYSDIDSNNHVNNVKYIEMSIDTLPEDIVNNYRLSNIKVLFKKETSYGDTIHISTEVMKNENDKINTLHTITSTEGKLLTKLQLEWKQYE